MALRVLALAIALVLLTASAAAEPIRLTVPTTVSDGNGNSRGLPPGYFLEDADWTALDLELRRLQERETRLAAENKSLREIPDTPWLSVMVGVAAGLAAGFLAGRL